MIRRKLALKSETLRLIEPELSRVRGGVQCTDTCDVCDSLVYTCYNTCTAVAVEPR